jgi:hypothetical protein
VKGSRGDFDQLADGGIDDISARVFYRPCWLNTPGSCNRSPLGDGAAVTARASGHLDVRAGARVVYLFKRSRSRKLVAFFSKIDRGARESTNGTRIARS